MFVISINYKNVPASVRELHALDQEKALAMQEELKKSGISESVFLNTCNRCELYGRGDYTVASGILAACSGVDVSEMKTYAFFYERNAVIRHLFRVCSGIESMVIGEDEILGQVKGAYEAAREGGFTDFYFNTIFQAAISSAKNVKTQTLLSKSSVSVATIAADKCRKFKTGMKTVLVIGASGDTGKKLVKNLLSYHDSVVYATVRNVHVQENGLRLIPYDDRYSYVDRADIIVSATKSPHYTITRARLEAAGLSKKERLFVDLAVPRDIDEEILKMEGSSLINIDQIQELARKNNELKKSQAQLAQELIDESVDDCIKNLAFHDFIPDFRQMKDHEKEDFEHFVYKYRKAASAEEFISFIKVLRRMEKGDLQK